MPIIIESPLDLIHTFPQVASYPPPPENMMKTQERQYVAALVLANLQTRNIFEFGTFEGFTTYYLFRACPFGKIYTLDLPLDAKHNEHPKEFLGHHYKSNQCNTVIQILEDSKKFDPVKHDIQPCDLVLVDGDHSMEGVENDCSKGLVMLRSGGILILHDYTEERDLKTVGPRSYVLKHKDWTWHRIDGTGFIWTRKP